MSISSVGQIVFTSSEKAEAASWVSWIERRVEKTSARVNARKARPQNLPVKELKTTRPAEKKRLTDQPTLGSRRGHCFG